MGGQKSEPINLTTERTKVNRTNRNNQPTADKLQTNRHQDVLLLSYLHSPYLCAYLRACASV